jgi:hypothetical protein
MAVTVASAVMQQQATADAADAQAQAIKQNRDAERMDTERQMQQAQEVGAATINAHALQSYKDMATFDAIAGESGGGVSAQRGAAAMGIQSGQDLATVAANAQRGSGELAFSDIASGNKAAQSFASIKQPSMAELGLTIAGAGASYNASMLKMGKATGIPKTT